ncbi:MAG: S9 family peptidase [Treponema sp.]|nr:S9 family peptidase [Treponema sp.]
MNKAIIKPLIVFAACVTITFVCAGFAAHVRNGFGSVEVSTGFIVPEQSRAMNEMPVKIAYRLYKPNTAAAANPAAAVLAMHGYQSDKDTNMAFCIELARRGIVVLSIDSYGHGDSKPGMRGRGWAHYNIKNLDKTISGPKRFMIMMTFSILDFFRPSISDGLADSSMGGKDAWQYLSSLPFVDSNRMGITGHSMGTWSGWSVAAEFPEHRAIVHQCGEIFALRHYDSENIKFNNVMMLQALIEEFENMRDYNQTILGLEKTPLRYRDFMGQDAPVEWNRTYGSFADGSARRMELIKTNHRLVTYDSDALAPAMKWFTTALEVNTNIADTDHVQWLKECLNLIAMLAAMVSMLPLFLILTNFKYFESLSIPLKSNPKMLEPKSRTTTVLIAVIISGVTFPFVTQLGHGLLPLPENMFRMTIGNGFLAWLGLLMIIALITMYRWYRKGEGVKTGWTLTDLGMEGPAEKGIKIIRPSYKWQRLAVRSVIMAFILTGTMYILTCISAAVFQMDFRFIWPFFRPFNLARFGQFLVYLPVYAAFFTINAGVKLYGQLRLPEYKIKGQKSDALTQLAWWGYSILVMLGGLFIIAFIQYIPFFMGFGPGADLFFSSLFGGPFMSILILLVPQFAVLFFFSTWLYRKSGTVYVGSFVLAILATWVVSGGSAVF